MKCAICGKQDAISWASSPESHVVYAVCMNVTCQDEATRRLTRSTDEPTAAA